MSSAGNDIVALAAIDPQRTNQRRFYSKILAGSEQALYDGQLSVEMPFENFVWLLWSIKESVYKYLKRTEPALLFSPTKVLVGNIEAPHSRPADSPGLLHEQGKGDGWEKGETGPDTSFYKGRALWGARSFYFRSKIHPEFISTVVHDEDNFGNIRWGARSIGHPDYDHQSAAVRAFALDKLNAVLSAGHDSHWRIGKSPLGYPVVFKDGEEMPIPLSFAHHGRFIACSFFLALTGDIAREPSIPIRTAISAGRGVP